jgi:hypothetical protein
MILSFMARASHCIQISAMALAPWQHPRTTDWTGDYKDAIHKLRAHLTKEFIAVSGMGRLPENVRGMLRALLMPIDIFSRYKSLENIDTGSHIVASQRVVSIAELNWIDNRLGTYKPELLLDASSYRPDHAWLFEASCLLKLCDILFCQHNNGFDWMGNCVLVDRDLVPDLIWNQAVARRPCIMLFGSVIVLAWKDHVFCSRDMVEIIFAWIMMVRDNQFLVRIDPQHGFTIRKEITTLIDMCFPHLLD